MGRRERMRELIGLGGEAWKEQGGCRGSDPNLWIGPDDPEREDRAARLAREREAKIVCGLCEVRSECLDWAVANRERGIWGGLTDRERRGLAWTNSRKTS